ncbi:hypothetical protein ABPG77_006467 [Micractinium sp. CCAP 211/92]
MPGLAQCLWLLPLLLLSAAAGVHAGGRKLSPPVTKVTFRATYETAAPDCFERPVILVNGQLSPKLEVTQGDILELTLINDIPPTVPTVAGGISIHFHGLNMRGAPWYDGVAYIESCPVAPGTSFTYRFQVNEMPGTYFWHGHTGADRGDGLAGPMVVHPRKGEKLPVNVTYDGEHTIFLSDWWHTTSAALAMPLNRPFDSARQTNDTGGFVWVNNPQSLLINSRGCYLDCALGPGGSKNPVNCSIPAANYWIGPGRSAQQPWASAVNPGCSHENITVEAGKTYLLRIINSASLTYQTVCFEGHDVTIVAADTVPVEPIAASKFNGCIDVNSGQRYDVLLKADKAASNYWISAHVQYRPGSPSGYAVLRYKGAPETLPSTPLPQPGSVAAWTLEQDAQIVMSSQLKNFSNKGVAGGVYRESISAVPNATVSLQLNITQPLMEQTGQIRWAINNVAGQNPSPCKPLLDLVYQDPKWIQKNVVPAKDYMQNGFNSSALGSEITRDGKGRVDVFLTTPGKAHPSPVYPTAGTHLIPLKKGEIVEVVLQNLNANANNGDYRGEAGVNRTAQEQHPFHLHGHHFWVLGSGLGVYDPAANASSLNTVNPPLRDTATLPQSGWVVLRFKADNPGVWIFHCHLLWHQYMGQMVMLAEAVDELPDRPKGLPRCPSTCYSNAAPWKHSFVRKEWGSQGYEIP